MSRSVETRRSWPAFIAAFKALLMSSRSTSLSSFGSRLAFLALVHWAAQGEQGA
jgi:hypothetical protein